MTMITSISVGALSAKVLQDMKKELEAYLRDLSKDMNPDVRIVMRQLMSELDTIDKLLMERHNQS